MIGNRIRQARLSSGLTLEEVVERLSHTITKQGLSKYENNKSIPKPDFLARLAEVLGVKTAYFLYEPRVQIKWLAYRKHSRLTKTKQSEIEARALDLAEAHLYLHTLFYPEEKPEFPTPQRVSTAENAEDVAMFLRKTWGLDRLPIESMVGLIEDRGGIVMGWAEEKFDGLSGWANETVPVIVCNSEMPDDRWRYNLGHELGHLMMRCENVTPKEEEALAHRFAAAFLVPNDVAYRELGLKRRHLDFMELGLLKRKYGLSISAWIRRAYDLNIISDSQYKDLNIQLRSRGFYRNEPYEYKGQEEPVRLKQLASRALAEGLISKEWFNRISPETGIDEPMAREDSVSEAQRVLLEELMSLPAVDRAEILAAAADRLKRDYSQDEDLTAFTDLDGEEFGDEPE